MKNLNTYTKNLFILSGLFLLCIIIYGANFTLLDFLKVVPTGILLAITSFSFGGTLGFIFGLPTYNNKKEEITYERNTSLKEIADWLTKIIIGVTLVELKSIIKYFQKIIVGLSEYLEVGNSGIIFSGTILISFFFIGFVSVYLLTITDVFKYLANNDKLIRSILKGANLNDDTVNVTQFTNEDVELNKNKRLQVLEFVQKNGTNIEHAYIAKRLGKILYVMKEYAKSAEYYKKAYDIDKKDIKSKINEAFIRSKFLKESKNSNKILKDLIKKDSTYSIPYYNLACNYNREFIEVKDKNINEQYKKDLEVNINNNLTKAFELDNGLLSESLIDEALKGIDIHSIFDKVYKMKMAKVKAGEEEE